MVYQPALYCRCQRTQHLQFVGQRSRHSLLVFTTAPRPSLQQDPAKGGHCPATAALAGLRVDGSVEAGVQQQLPRLLVDIVFKVVESLPAAGQHSFKANPSGKPPCVFGPRLAHRTCFEQAS